MAQCDMCSASVPLQKVKIEGVLMMVCKDCSKFGEVVKTPRPPSRARAPVSRGTKPQARPRRRYDPDENKYVLPGIGAKIKAARECMGIRQIDLSRKISVSESEIHQVESGHLTPTLDVARKFQKGLGIKCVGEGELGASDDDEDIDIPMHRPAHGMTIADMIKKK